MDINKAHLYQKVGYNNTNTIRNIVNRVNLNPVNFGYLSNDDQMKGNDNCDSRAYIFISFL